MSEVERYLHCDNCDSSARIIFDAEACTYEPEVCPFCGENLGAFVDEYDDEDLDILEDEDLLDDLDEK